MQISPDDWIIWGEAPFSLNATIVFSWVVMAVLVFVAWLATRRIEETLTPSRWQSLLETVVISVRDQIAELSPDKPARGLSFIATLFLFIFASNVMAIIPGFRPPTASLSTTAALAILVLIAVPVIGIMSEGPIAYLRHYIRPTVFMLPFNLIGEVTRTISLAVRLYGNVMSGTVLAAITLTIAPFFFRRWALQVQLYWAGRSPKTLEKEMTRPKFEKTPCKTPLTMLEDSVQNK